MSTKTLYAAETWDRVYSAFENVNFVSYDYDTIKESLLQYLKIYYPEHFNNFIESDELIAIIESFAFVAEQMAYRVDMVGHENNMETAERKQSILRLAKFLSYKATRNLPARGLVKIHSITTTERVIDSQGTNIADRVIVWNDNNNPLWKEHFFLVINRVMSKVYGQPSKTFQVDDIELQLYGLKNTANSFINGVYQYSVRTNSLTIPMELVSSDIDKDGPFERYVDGSSKMNIMYSSDGLGDASDMTGFLMYTKQGTLTKSEYFFESPIPNRHIDLTRTNINDTDVWVNKVDEHGTLIQKWQKVNDASAQNVYFSTDKARNKYEIESLEDDKIRVIFGDGDFSDIPLGHFDVFTRHSLNKNLVIHKSKIVNETSSFNYNSTFDVEEICSISFSLVSTLQNAAISEDIEHIRRNAPSTYYSQNRMVNGQDYNTLLLKDSSILKLRTVNRTFSGQPKHLEWNDASGNYQNVKIFGDDMRIFYDFSLNLISSVASARTLIDTVIEPIVQSPGIQNMIMYVGSITSGLSQVRTSPRHKFIERSTINIQEKTSIQGILDRHFYGEPTSFSVIDGKTYGEVSADTDYKIYQDNLPRTRGGLVYQDSIPSGLQPLAAEPEFGIRYDRVIDIIGQTEITTISMNQNAPAEVWTVECINEAIDGGTFSVTGSVSGTTETATLNKPYDNGLISFIIPVDVVNHIDFVVGDAFIVTYDGLTISTMSTNLGGKWSIIAGSDLDSVSDFDLSTAGTHTDSSWLLRVKRNDDSVGNIIDWSITYRDLKIVISSLTTKFWYNSSTSIIDSGTKNKVRDSLSVLKSNLNKNKQFAIGTNQVYDVIGPIYNDDGTVDPNSLEVFPIGNIDQSNPNKETSIQFSEFVNVFGNTDYVYFWKNAANKLELIDATNVIVSSFTGNNTISNNGKYYRKIGRDNLDFLWQHFSPNTNLIDPSTSNINDIFVITKGYYDSVKNYLNGKTILEPIPPTSLELRNNYKDILNTKVISDTTIMHSGKIKILFGELADPQLRCKFRVIKSPSASLTDDQIKSEIMLVIEKYFMIENWDFGDTFYATELNALIHQRLPVDISSVALVPTFINNSFGSLFVIESGEDEILQSSLSINDIEIVATFSPTVLRQN